MAALSVLGGRLGKSGVARLGVRFYARFMPEVDELWRGLKEIVGSR